MPTGSFLSFDLKINGVNASTYGFYLSELRGQWDGPTRRVEELVIPGREGTTPESDEDILEPLDFVAVGVIRGDDAEDMEDKLDDLKFALLAATLTIIGGNRETRERTGKWNRAPIRPFVEMNAATIEIGIRCHNPLAFETTPTTVTGSADEDKACELGTYKVRPVITLTGATDPTVTYKNSDGDTVETMEIDTGGTPATVVIDMDEKTITIDGDDSPAALTAGDFFALEPRDGDRATSDWPTVRTSSGSLSIVYRKAWS